MKRILEILLTTAVLATMYGMSVTNSPNVNTVSQPSNADVVMMADGADPMPRCRRCK